MAKNELEWDLESIFSTADSGREFFSFLESLQEARDSFRGALMQKNKEALLSSWQTILSGLRHSFGYVACLAVENASFENLERFQRACVVLEKEYRFLALEALLFIKKLSPNEFENWNTQAQLGLLGEYFDKKREEPFIDEALLHALQKLFVPLGELYQEIVARLRLYIEGVGFLDIEAAESALLEESSFKKESLFLEYQEIWKKEARVLAALLNQIYNHRVAGREWNLLDPLDESLRLHQLSRSSLETMWKIVEEEKASLLVFLNKKAGLFGRRQPRWSDIWAPRAAREKRSTLRFHEATEWVQAALSRLGPEVSQFMRGLQQEGAIVACSPEILKKGAYCSFALPFPLKRRVRLLLAYNESCEQILDYGREVARAWCYHMLFEYPEMLQGVPFVVCEAFQVFTERLVLEVVKERGCSRQQRFDVLFGHLQRGLLAILDKRVCYLFESELVKQKTNTSLTEETLCLLMEQAQEAVYAGQISSSFRYYWASQKAFYKTTAPAFQNYPQTMGYLLGLSLYKLYLRRPEGFCEKLKKWLKESTLQHSLEESLSKEFGLQLGHESVWKDAMSLVEADVRALASLIEIKDKTFAFETKEY